MMIKIQILIIVAITGLSLNACKQNIKPSESPKTSLMKYGFPLDIITPEGVSIIKNKNAGADNLIVTNNTDFNIQINMTDAISNSLLEMKARERENMKANPFFLKILEDYDDGFLFEYATQNGIAYDFRLFKIQGSKTYTFQSGMTGQYTESQIKNMIKSIR